VTEEEWFGRVKVKLVEKEGEGAEKSYKSEELAAEKSVGNRNADFKSKAKLTVLMRRMSTVTTDCADSTPRRGHRTNTNSSMSLRRPSVLGYADSSRSLRRTNANSSRSLRRPSVLGPIGERMGAFEEMGNGSTRDGQRMSNGVGHRFGHV
jgi:hypothetical protein